MTAARGRCVSRPATAGRELRQVRLGAERCGLQADRADVEAQADRERGGGQGRRPPRDPGQYR